MELILTILLPLCGAMIGWIVAQHWTRRALQTTWQAAIQTASQPLPDGSLRSAADVTDALHAALQPPTHEEETRTLAMHPNPGELPWGCHEAGSRW